MSYRNRVRFDPAKEKDFRELHAAGVVFSEIGELLEIPGETANYWARKLKLPQRPRGRATHGTGRKTDMTSPRVPTSFTREKHAVAGRPMSFARFSCHKCPATLDIPEAGTAAVQPGVYARRARERGWLADDRHPASVVCPACQKKPPHDPDSELKKVLMNGTAHTNVTPLSPPMRELTSDDRAKIRGALEAHFDDGIGAYHDDWSDEKIATSLNVPRAWVERMREAAFGPIRLDPVMAGLRAEMTQAKRDLDAAKATLGKLESMLMGLSSRIEKRIEGRA